MSTKIKEKKPIINKRDYNGYIVEYEKNTVYVRLKNKIYRGTSDNPQQFVVSRGCHEPTLKELTTTQITLTLGDSSLSLVSI
jgi:hypothetical protein